MILYAYQALTMIVQAYINIRYMTVCHIARIMLCFSEINRKPVNAGIGACAKCLEEVGYVNKKQY
jgi:hypothetical protein